MPFEKGKSGNPAGRREGTANRATTAAREAIAKFVDGNVESLNGWLEAIAKKDPKQAFDCFMSVVEYHIPKLARAEMTGKEGKDLIPEKIDIILVKANPIEDGK